jgi:hypothetical protein
MEDCPCCGDAIDPDYVEEINRNIDEDDRTCPFCGRTFGEIREDM